MRGALWPPIWLLKQNKPFDSVFTHDGRDWQPCTSLHLIQVPQQNILWAQCHVRALRRPKSELGQVSDCWEGIVGGWRWGRGQVFKLLFRIKPFITKVHLMIKHNIDIKLNARFLHPTVVLSKKYFFRERKERYFEGSEKGWF